MTEVEKPAENMGVMVIDQAELIVRLLTAMNEAVRPEKQTAKELCDELPPDVYEPMARAATAAVDYMVECMNGGGIKTVEGKPSLGGLQ